jgi:hypothetical protein
MRAIRTAKNGSLSSSLLPLSLAAAAVAVAVVLSAGCSSSGSGPGSTADAGTDGGGGAWGFSSSGTGKETPAVVLALDSVDGDSVWVRVVVRGVSKLQGVAFRLKADASAASLSSYEVSKVWTSPASAFKAQKSGEIWAGIGHVGPKAIDATKDTTVARLKLSLSGSGPVTMTFRDHHNLVLDSTGEKVEASFVGGTLSRQ